MHGDVPTALRLSSSHHYGDRERERERERGKAVAENI